MRADRQLRGPLHGSVLRVRRMPRPQYVLRRLRLPRVWHEQWRLHVVRGVGRQPWKCSERHRLQHRRRLRQPLLRRANEHAHAQVLHRLLLHGRRLRKRYALPSRFRVQRVHPPLHLPVEPGSCPSNQSAASAASSTAASLESGTLVSDVSATLVSFTLVSFTLVSCMLVSCMLESTTFVSGGFA